jgi:predicted kinase
MDKSLEKIIAIINSEHKTLFILCGYPYSGKTFIANKVTATTGCVLVSIDSVFSDQGYDWTDNKLPDTNGWKEIMDVVYQTIRDALKAGNNVLYDSTNHTRASRDALRDVAQEEGAESQVILVDVPPETVYARWEANSKSPTRSVISKKLLEMTVNSFERPTEDEQILVLANTAYFA